MEKEALIAWVSEAKNGNEEAFAVLYQNYYPFAYNVAYKLTQCDADAKDAVQMSFLQMQKSIHQLQKIEFFPLWLHRIVTSKCKDIFRSNRDVTYDDEYFKYNKQAIEHRRYMLADKNMHFDSDRDVFIEIFTALKEDMREVLWMYYFEGLKINEIAEILHINENTVKSKMRRGKEFLKAEILAYEKQNHIKLDFNEDVIMAVLGISLFPFLTSKSKGLSTMNTKTIVLSSILSGGVILGGYALYQEYEKQQIPPVVHQAKAPTDGKAKEAYFKLCNWTFDKDHLANRSKASVQDMRPYYDYLKQQGGVYYETLVNTGWAAAFEQLSS